MPLILLILLVFLFLEWLFWWLDGLLTAWLRLISINQAIEPLYEFSAFEFIVFPPWEFQKWLKYVF